MSRKGEGRDESERLIEFVPAPEANSVLFLPLSLATLNPATELWAPRAGKLMKRDKQGSGKPPARQRTSSGRISVIGCSAGESSSGPTMVEGYKR